jgi:hypothetical protein
MRLSRVVVALRSPGDPRAIFSYRVPWIDRIDPPSAPTDACHQLEAFTEFHIGALKSASRDLPARLCCQPALVRITGHNFGPPSAGLHVFVGDAVVEDSCVAVAAAYRSNFSNSQQLPRVGVQCPAACTDELFAYRNPSVCPLRDTDAGAGREPCCLYNYPVNTGDIDSCRCPVPMAPCVLSWTHNQVRCARPLLAGMSR